MRFLLLVAALFVALASQGAAADDATTEIHLTQEATRQVPPDRLRASLRVEAKGADPRQVQADVNRRMKAALAKAKSHADVTAETGGYSVNRDFSQKDKVVWQGDQTIDLTSPNFDALLSLVGELQGDGLLIGELHFFLARDTLQNAQSALTSAALDELKTRADEVAHDLGLRVDHIEDLTVGNATASTNPVPLMRFAAAAAPAPPPVAQAGDATVSLTVQADVILTRVKP
jgi:uncharacterized protein